MYHVQRIFFKIFWGGGVPPLKAFGVSTSFPKTNPFSTILDAPLVRSTVWESSGL